MNQSSVSNSEAETERAGGELAQTLFGAQPVFVRLSGPLGAGKSAFARGFIRQWLMLAKEAPFADAIVSPTYNIVKTYGTKAPLAHLDLYRLKSLRELEEIGYEHYFYELPCCLVEWLEQIPEALRAMPERAVVVELCATNSPNQRTVKVRSSKETS